MRTLVLTEFEFKARNFSLLSVIVIARYARREQMNTRATRAMQPTAIP